MNHTTLITLEAVLYLVTYEFTEAEPDAGLKASLTMNKVSVGGYDIYEHLSSAVHDILYDRLWERVEGVPCR